MGETISLPTREGFACLHEVDPLHSLPDCTSGWSLLILEGDMVLQIFVRVAERLLRSAVAVDELDHTYGSIFPYTHHHLAHGRRHTLFFLL